MTIDNGRRDLQELADRLAVWCGANPRDSGARELLEDTVKVLRDSEWCAAIVDTMPLDGVRRVNKAPRLSIYHRQFTKAPRVMVYVGWWRWLVPGGRKKIKRELSERLPAGVAFEFAPWWW